MIKNGMGKSNGHIKVTKVPESIKPTVHILTKLENEIVLQISVNNADAIIDFI